METLLKLAAGPGGAVIIGLLLLAVFVRICYKKMDKADDRLIALEKSMAEVKTTIRHIDNAVNNVLAELIKQRRQ